MDLSSGTDHIKDFTDGVDKIDIGGLPTFTIGRIDNDATIFQEDELIAIIDNAGDFLTQEGGFLV